MSHFNAMSSGPLTIRDIGSFHLGGRVVRLDGLASRDMQYSENAREPIKVDRNGEYHVEQMYVQYVLLADPRAGHPLILMHGGRASGVTWETTPDGRPGFQRLFLARGHDVYVCDAVERGRASFAPPEVWHSDPFFPVARTTWDISRIGPPGSYTADPAERVTYANTRFPVHAFDQQMKQRMPRWTTNDDATQAAYDALAVRMDSAVLLAHSTGAHFAMQMALNAPDRIKGIVLLEPAGAPLPSPASSFLLRNIPFLYVWGDHREEEKSMQSTLPLATRWRDSLATAGASVDWIDLPAMGIEGNTHMLMMDDNNEEIADLIQQWMLSKSLVDL